MNIKVYTPPTNILDSHRCNVRIFLAGTIDMGVSVDWQAEMIRMCYDQADLANYSLDREKSGSGIAIYNPRRSDWNSDWEQDIDNPEFRRQVEWELLGLKQSTHILFNFLPDSKSPITLLELGLYAASGKCAVICPKEYHRSGNVHIICEHYGIPMYPTIYSYLYNFFP